MLSEDNQPNDILLLDGLPYGPSGKVELGKLKTQVEGLLSTARASEQCDVDKLAVAILDIAAKIFNTRREALAVSMDADAVSGWDSFSFLELVMSLERKFDIKLDARDVMNVKTLQNFVDIVAAKQ